jgi:hemin uptake protein HemP
MTTDPEETPPKTSDLPPDGPPPAKPVAIQFEAIAQGETEILIEYRDQRYRLRATKNGKLILNK